MTFSGKNTEEGKITFDLTNGDGKTVASGWATKDADSNWGDDPAIRWNGKLKWTKRASSKPVSEDFELIRLKNRAWTQIELMHGYFGDGPILLSDITVFVARDNLGVALEKLQEMPGVNGAHAYGKDKRGVIPGHGISVSIGDKQTQNLDPWEFVARLRTDPLFDLVDVDHDGAGSGAEDIIEVPNNLLQGGDGKLKPENVKKIISNGITALIAANQKDKWPPVLQEINVRNFSATVKLKGSLSSLTGQKSNKLVIATYSFTIARVDSTPDGHQAIILGYVEGKWNDAPIAGGRIPNDEWFTEEIEDETVAFLSGTLANQIAKAANCKIIFSVNSPFSNQ